MYVNMEVRGLSNYRDCKWDIVMALRSNKHEVSEPVVYLAAYLLFKACDYNDMERFAVEDIYKLISDADASIKSYAKEVVPEYITEDVWKKLIGLISKYGKEDFRSVVVDSGEDAIDSFRYGNEYNTPGSMGKLAVELLDLDGTYKVADLCCGNACSTMLISNRSPESTVTGYDNNFSYAVCASIKAELCGKAFKIEQKDIFTLPEENIKFDRIFMDHPLGGRIPMMGCGKQYLDKKNQPIGGMSHVRSSDWLYNYLLLDLMAKNGKAVTIVTNGSTWNYEDQLCREMFCANNYIECIIALPQSLYSYSNIATTMIVFSKNAERRPMGIYMVDATGCFVKGRRRNELSDDNINEIIEACRSGRSEIGRFVEYRELCENNYVLNPGRYLAEKKEIKDAVKFESVIQEITRGAGLRASELDEMVSDTRTGCQYLMLANIQNGIISKDLPYIKEIPDNMKKYCIGNHDLLLSKNGAPFKVAVAEIEEGQQILANGNLYIIRLNEVEIDPYFLKAFFESDLGKAQLKSITVGTTIPCIGVKELKALMIPKPSLDEQKKIAQKYLAIQDEIKMLELKLDRAVTRIGHIFDDVEGGNA